MTSKLKVDEIVDSTDTGSPSFPYGVTFAGAVSGTTGVFSANSASTALRITQTGAGNALVVEDIANPDATPFVIDGGGTVVIGGTTALTGGKVNLVRGGTDTVASTFDFNRDRNGSPVLSGDGLGQHRYYGFDGTGYVQAASILAAVDGTPGTGDMPGRLVFSTTADGASSPTERMRIRSDGNVAIGGTGFTTVSFTNQKDITGGTTAYSNYTIATVQSDVTTAVFVNRTQIGTQASAFTLNALTHYDATQNPIGATSSVTNQYGFVAGSTLTGATNNYGFYSNIASGTGRWNFYANGTAANYFAGDVRIGTNVDSGYPLRVFGKTYIGDGTNVTPDVNWNGQLTIDGSGYRAGLAADATGLWVGTNSASRGVVLATDETARVTVSGAGLVSLAAGSGLSISRTAVTAPAASDGNVFSGTYTPTLTNATNISASTATVCQYMRVGDVVTVSGSVSITPTAAAGASTTLRMSLPIASNFAAARQCGGSCSYSNATASLAMNGSINGDATNDTANFVFNATITSAGNFYFTFTYLVV